MFILVFMIPLGKVSGRAWSRLLFGLILFLAVSTFFRIGLPWDRQRGGAAGMEPASVVSMRGFCSEDSRPLSGRRVMFSLKEPLCLDIRGNEAVSRGYFTVLLTGDASLFKGQEVLVSGRFSESAESGNTGSGYVLFRAGEVKKTGGWKNRLSGLRAGIIRRLDSEFFSRLGEPGGFLKALLLGFRDDLSTGMSIDFKRAGVMHILALSGMHLGLLTGFLSIIFMPILGKRYTLPFLSIFLLFYLFLTGFRTSLFRAAVMFFISGFASFSGRKISPLRNLCLTFLISAAVEPSGLFLPGFQLSFGALGGIFLAGIPLAKIISSRLPGCLGLLAYPLGISIGAQAATLPILLIHFNEFVPTGVVCGLFLTPVVTAFLWFGLCGLILSAFYPIFDTGLFSFLFELLYTLIVEVVAFFSGFPGLVLSESAAEKTGTVILILLLGGVITGILKRGYGIYKLRFSQRDSGNSGIPRALHVEEIRSEFSD